MRSIDCVDDFGYIYVINDSSKLFQLSGREMFSFNPELAAGDMFDDGDEAFDSYAREDEDEVGTVKASLIQIFIKLFYFTFILKNIFLLVLFPKVQANERVVLII